MSRREAIALLESSKQSRRAVSVLQLDERRAAVERIRDGDDPAVVRDDAIHLARKYLGATVR